MKRTVLITLVVILSTFVITAGCCDALDSEPEQSHDVAITNMSAPSSCVQGAIVPVVVNVVNQGSCGEYIVVKLINVTDGSRIGTQSVTLSAAGKGGLDDVANLILTGKKSGDQFGDYISTGDVNNDGYEDFLVSAAHYNQKQGRVYLYYGGTNMDENPDKIFTGETIDDWFGNRICLGDVNGDNYDDVIIGAVKYGDVDHQGRAYLYYGDRDMDENADLIFDGETGTQGWFGSTIAAGDVNNDGYDDLFIAALAYDNNRGRVYLYYGGDPMDTNAAKILDGEGAGNVFGYWLDAGGDVDGDGCKDLLVGTLFYPNYETDKRGRAYLYYGDTGTSMDEICDVTFTAENDGDEFASSIDVFDIDNDGFGDVLIGARRWPAGGLQGRAYLYWGSSRPNMNGHADKIFEGEKGVNACLGGNAIRGGYVNNDDYGDIYIAGYTYPPDFTGRGYLYYGNTKASMDVICDHTFTGYERMSSFGKEAQLADLNNDGLDDIILGAWRYNNFQGRVYLYYSKPGDHTDLTFNWDTTGAFTGQHTLKSEIVPVEGEEDKEDNGKTITVNVKSRVKGKEER